MKTGATCKTCGQDAGEHDDKVCESRRIKGTPDPPVVAEELRHIMQFFAYDHLRPDLAFVSEPFYQLAQTVAALPRNPERTVSLRKLLEAKDAALRAKLAR